MRWIMFAFVLFEAVYVSGCSVVSSGGKTVEWISLVVEFVGIVVIIISLDLVRKQVRFVEDQIIVAKDQVAAAQKQITTNADLARRERALGMMEFWNNNHNNFKTLNKAVVELVEGFSEQQCQSLWEMKEIILNNNHYNRDLVDHLEKIHKEFNPAKKGIDITLGKPDVQFLRTITLFVLNMLETVATAWMHNIADREILENEFIGVIVKNENQTILDTLRDVSGIYPSLSEFSRDLKEKWVDRNRKSGKKPVEDDE